MSNTKKPEEDIIAIDTTDAENISDEALEEVEGGWSWGANMTTKFSQGGYAETITASGGFAETITANVGDDILGKGEMGDVGKVGMLRRRPTR